MTPAPVYYTPEEVAVRTVYRMIRAGELAVKRAGRRYCIPEWDLRAAPLRPASQAWARRRADRPAGR